MAQFGAIALALVGVGLVCTVSEGYLFVPEVRKYAVAELVGGTVLYLTVAAVLVGLAKLWHFSESADHEVVHRSMRWTIPMVFLAGFLYLVYYQVFGSITFYFFTQKYYPHAAELAKTMGLWFWVYQWARGSLMTLAVIPIIYSLRLRRWQAAGATGLILWILGGGAGLLVPNIYMATAQRYIHIVEIFTQNFSLGVTAVVLLRTRPARSVVNEQVACRGTTT